MRIATYAAPLSRDGPGLLLRDIGKDDPQINAIVAAILRAEPDVLLLTDFDYDHDLLALSAFAAMLDAGGHAMAHAFALKPNTGLQTGLDLDGNGRLGEARDAMGYGRFEGDGGMAILSTLPIEKGAVRDLSDILWKDLPGATLPPMGAAIRDQQRLSSSGHWIVPIGPITLLAFSATPPVFDGPEDRNGLRNRDELRLWRAVLDGSYGTPPSGFVIAGNSNLDPVDGDGYAAEMAAFLDDPRLTDPKPISPGAILSADATHRGDPAMDTADWRDETPGNLRVSYVLPAASFEVMGSGVIWPDPSVDDLLGSDGQLAGPHRLVWVDIAR